VSHEPAQIAHDGAVERIHPSVELAGSRPVRRAAGLSLGAWLWLVRLPTARVLLPGGEVAFVQGPPATPLPVFRPCRTVN
jgi:hypothetical protein